MYFQWQIVNNKYTQTLLYKIVDLLLEQWVRPLLIALAYLVNR